MIGERAINGKVTKGRMQCRMGKTRDESAVNRAAVRRDERNDRNELKKYYQIEFDCHLMMLKYSESF